MPDAPVLPMHKPNFCPRSSGCRAHSDGPVVEHCMVVIAIECSAIGAFTLAGIKLGVEPAAPRAKSVKRGDGERKPVRRKPEKRSPSKPPKTAKPALPPPPKPAATVVRLFPKRDQPETMH